MATVTINSVVYDSYSSVADADTYLAADFERAATWATRTVDQKGQGLVTATRLLQRLNWAAGEPPSTDDPVEAVVAEATALLAADILVTPTLGSGARAGASNVRRAKAGSAEVEFFRPQAGTLLPQAAFDLLRDLLGGSGTDGLGLVFVSGNDFCSRFDRSDWDLLEPFR